MTEEIKEDDPNEKLKKRALDAYKRNKSDMETLAKERRQANTNYYGEPRGDEVEGRSQVISRDVFEVIEQQMPDLMKIFYGGQNVVEVSAQGRNDEPKAKLMEEKINFDFQKTNKGFKILYQFFKDALLHRIGCVYYVWDKTPKWKYHEYEGVSETYIRDLEMGVLGNPHIIDEKISVSEGGISPEGILIEPTYNIQCREKIKQSRPLFTNVKLEDINFPMDMVDVEDLEAVIDFRVRIHKRKLKEYGFDETELDDMMDKYDANADIQSRFEDLGGLSFVTDDKDSDFVYLHQFYMYDFDKEGNPIPKIVFMVGEKVGKVVVNKYGRPQFCFITPTIIAHRLVGLSSEFASKDIQDISTGFLRIILDSGYYQNLPREIWNPFAVENIPEEIIPGMKTLTADDRDPRTAVYTMEGKALPPQFTQVYSQIMPKIKGRRFGITDFSAGLDPKALATRTSGGISQLMSSSMRPLELIARCFAETGVRDIFVADMQMNIDFLDTETNIKINEEWITIKRDDINGLFDITIDVGIGTGSKDMTFNHLINMLNVYGGIAGAIKDPVSIQQVFSLDNVKNILNAAWEMIGFKNSKGRFTANDAARPEPNMGQPNPEGQAVPGPTGQPNIQGIAGGGGQVYPQQMAAMPY